MALSRREFVWRLGAGGVGVATASHVIGYGREELLAFTGQGQRAAAAPASIRLSSNENLRGPSPKVIEVLKQHPSKDLGLGYPPPERQRIRRRMRGDGRRETEEHHYLDRIRRNPDRRGDGVLQRRQGDW